MIKKTRRMLFGAGLALVIAIGSFTFVQMNTGPMIQTRVNFHLDSDFGSSLIRVAAAEGIFTKHGIDAELEDYVDGAAAVNAMLNSPANEIALATSAGVSFTSFLPSTKGIKIISQMANDEDNYYWLVRNGKGDGTVKGLRGLKIGAPSVSGYLNFLRLSLEDHGIKDTDVTLVPMQASEFAAAMADGRIDAHPSRILLTEKTLKAVNGEASELHDKGAYDWFNVLSTTTSTIGKHSIVLTHVLDALLETQTSSYGKSDIVRAAVAESLGISVSLVPKNVMEFSAIRLSNGLTRQMLTHRRLLAIDTGIPESEYFKDPRDVIEVKPLTASNAQLVHLG